MNLCVPEGFAIFVIWRYLIVSPNSSVLLSANNHGNCLSFAGACEFPPVFGGVHVAHQFSSLCSIYCFVYLRLVYPMLPVHLVSPIFIAPSVFSNPQWCLPQQLFRMIWTTCYLNFIIKTTSNEQEEILNYFHLLFVCSIISEHLTTDIVKVCKHINILRKAVRRHWLSAILVK